MQSDLRQRDRRKRTVGEEERSGLPGTGQEEISVFTSFAGLVQESDSAVCQGERVVAWRHSKGNRFLGSC